ncbi:hypothetical protein LXL04_010508 [Taraxacum kok-saghyz]
MYGGGRRMKVCYDKMEERSYTDKATTKQTVWPFLNLLTRCSRKKRGWRKARNVPVCSGGGIGGRRWDRRLAATEDEIGASSMRRLKSMEPAGKEGCKVGETPIRQCISKHCVFRKQTGSVRHRYGLERWFLLKCHLNCIVLNVHRCLVVFLLGTPDSTTNPNQRCHLLPSPPSRPEPHPTTAAIPIPGLSCSCGTTDLHLPPFSIAAGVGSSTIADAVGEENRRPSPPNLHHPLVYSSGDQGAANQFHRHLPPSLSVSLSLPDSCCQRRKAAFTIELEASPSLKNTSTTVASPTRLHLSNRTADLLFFPSSEIGPGRGVDRVPSLVPDSNRFHAC